jgi:uncharacterized protein YdbL (DUF1318 family)
MRKRITTMKKFAMLLGLILSVSLSSLALAITLDEAKAQGLVGEKVDGYISAVGNSPSTDVQALITSTNDGRRKVYVDLAQRNGITVEAVGVLSAEKLRASAASGEYVQLESGQWQRKP